MASPTQDTMDSPLDIPLPPELGKLSSYIDEKPEAFGAGNKDLQVAALQAVKYVFDLALQSESKSRAQITELLASISPSQAPQTRSQTAKNAKRKRSPTPPAQSGPVPQETPLSELCVDGMAEDQLWAQLELRAKNVCEFLDYALEGSGEIPESDEELDGRESKMRKVMMDGEMDMDDMEDMDFEGGESDEEDSDEDGSDEEDGDEGGEEDEEDEEDGDEAEFDEQVAELRDPSDEENESELDLDKPSILLGGKRPTRWKAKAGGHPELNDGFFDLAKFNAETEEAEARAVSKGKLGKDDGEDSDEDLEDPVDFFRAVDDTAEEEDTQELFYKDFFDPPQGITSKSAKSSKTKEKSSANGRVRFHEEVRVKKIKANGKNLPTAQMYIEEEEEEEDEDGFGEKMSLDNEDEDEDEDDGMDQEDEGDSEAEDSDEEMEGSDEEDRFDDRETMERLKDDLFADDEDPETGLSAHEKRMSALREEIAALESENVAKKHWTLMGEATSRSRPQNALLEEDLEFERVMKSVPVITEEVVQGLEERIKARILESRFDDVVRKRPVDDKPFLPSRFFELQDTKSKQSLAEIYEDEYVAAKTGGVAGEDRDGKLKKEHDEIEKLWENICHKLDALCNAHFTPKAPKASISTISNVAAATLESAMPTTKATTTMLAPEEVFAPSAADSRARSELTPIEKRTLRNKQKKANKKARDTLEKSVDKYAKANGPKSIKKQKEAALKSVVKSGKGVTVIGKKSQDAKGKKERTKK